MTDHSRSSLAADIAELVAQGHLEEALNRYPEREPEIRMMQQLKNSPPEAMLPILAAVEHANAHHREALQLSRNGNLRGAEAAFDKAIQLVPEFVTAYMNRAILYARTNRRPKALSDLQTAVRLAPRSERAKGMLAQAQAGMWERFNI